MRLYRKRHTRPVIHLQMPASRRLTPIKAASDTTNRRAAAVNIGASTGEMAGAVTWVWRMMNTFKQFSRFGEISEKDPSNRAARREVICPIHMPMSVARRTHSWP